MMQILSGLDTWSRQHFLGVVEVSGVFGVLGDYRPGELELASEDSMPSSDDRNLEALRKPNDIAKRTE